MKWRWQRRGRDEQTDREGRALWKRKKEREKDIKREIDLTLEEWSSVSSKSFWVEFTITLETHTHTHTCCGYAVLCCAGWTCTVGLSTYWRTGLQPTPHHRQSECVCACRFTRLGFNSVVIHWKTKVQCVL